MYKTKKLLLILFLFLLACTEPSKKKLDKAEILQKGAELYAKYACAVCHSLEGKEIYGPPLNGIYMKKIKVLRDGKELELVADRDYLKKSISDPRYEKVLEYQNKEMPISNFSEEEAEILVDYLIALQEENEPLK